MPSDEFQTLELRTIHLVFYQGILTEGGRLSTIDLLVLTSFSNCKLYLLFYKTSSLNEEVNCIDPSPSGRVPWLHPFVSAFGQAIFIYFKIG
jgi:hypothetical protein